MITEGKLIVVVRNKTSIKLIFRVPLKESDNDFETLEGLSGYVCFIGKKYVSEIEKMVENKYLGVDLDSKTWSQQLRGMILQVWNASKSKLTADMFYSEEMKKLVEHYKLKLQKFLNADTNG